MPAPSFAHRRPTATGGPTARPLGAGANAGLYGRVSTTDQNTDNQLVPLRAFASARGWTVIEFTDVASGARERRPGLDELLNAVRSRKVDVVICAKLDRLARSTHHLVTLAKEWEALGVDLIVLDQAIDTTTPTGRLLFHVLAAIAEFERDLIRERVKAGLARAKAKGVKLGRRPKLFSQERLAELRRDGASIGRIARELHLSRATARRRLHQVLLDLPAART